MTPPLPRFFFLAAALACFLWTNAIAAADSAAEDALRSRLAREILGKKFVDDLETAEYLNSLVRRISPGGVAIAVSRDNTVNAFAAAGGVIGVHDGLFLFARDESEFVGIIAHELAHLRQNHIARFSEKLKGATAIGLAGIIASLLVKDSEAREALIVGSGGLYAEKFLSYSRDFEREADAVGYRLLIAAGYDPAGFARFLRRLLLAEGGRGVPFYLRTHPATEERVSDILNRRRNEPAAESPTESADFPLMREKAAARHSRAVQRIMDRRATLSEMSVVAAGPKKIAALYGLLIAAGELDDKKTADEAIAQLKIFAPKIPAVARAVAAEWERRGDFARAEESLLPALTAHPGRISLAAHFADLLARRGMHKRLTEFAAELPMETAAHPALRRSLALAFERLGKPADSHLALAEADAAEGEFERAERQLRIALELAKQDESRRTAIESRLREIRAMVAELKKSAE